MPIPRLAKDIAITVDAEPDCPPYLWTWRGIEEGMPKLLSLLASTGVRATFFTTGETAIRYPETIRSLVADQHELACHGMTHRDFMRLGDEEATDEVAHSLQALRAFAPVTSFRAPYLRFPDRYLRILEQHAITLDSSQARYKPSRSADREQTRLLRIPASMTSSFLRLPSAIRDPILTRLASPIVLFVHPWEFVDFTKTALRWDCRFRTGQPALEKLREVITLFQSYGATFRRMDELGQLLAARQAAAVSS